MEIIKWLKSLGTKSTRTDLWVILISLITIVEIILLGVFNKSLDSSALIYTLISFMFADLGIDRYFDHQKDVNGNS